MALVNSIVPFLGNERNGIETLEKHCRLVHYDIYRTLNRVVLYRNSSACRKNFTKI